MEEQDMLGVVEINTGPLDDEFHNARDHPLSNGVRPAFFSEEWTAISEDPCFFPRFAGKVTRFLLSRPPPFSEKPLTTATYQSNSERAMALREQLNALLQRQAIEIVTRTSGVITTG